MHGVVTVRVGSLAVPTVIDDLAWVAARLGTTETERELAARITAGLRPGTQLELEPASIAEQAALAAALSELIWDRHGGQVLRRLREAVVTYQLNAPEPIPAEATDATLVSELVLRIKDATTPAADRE